MRRAAARRRVGLDGADLDEVGQIDAKLLGINRVLDGFLNPVFGEIQPLHIKVVALGRVIDHLDHRLERLLLIALHDDGQPLV